MFNWGSKDKGAPKPQQRTMDLAELKNQDLIVLFKHSPTCGVSWAAESQVKKFMAGNPDVPVYTISVRQDRELSRQIADATKIRHESPQVIVMRKGVAVADASHQDVTVDFLTQATRK